MLGFRYVFLPSKDDICSAISLERLAWFTPNICNPCISGMPGLIHTKLCTYTYFYKTCNSSLVSHLIRATLFFEQSRNLKKWYKMFVYHLTKFFFDEIISIKRTIYVPSFIKFRGKKFFSCGFLWKCLNYTPNPQPPPPPTSVGWGGAQLAVSSGQGRFSSSG